MNAPLALLPCLSLIAGCADVPAVTWRLPCGGFYYDEADARSRTDYKWEHDEAGHVLREEIGSGDSVWFITLSRYVGDEVVHRERAANGEAISYTYDVELVDGQRARAVEIERDMRTNTRWHWDGDQLIAWRSDDFTSATITYTQRGFTERICDVFGCSTKVGVGDYDHWTSLVEDDGSDSIIDRTTTITYDDHGLPLVEEVRYPYDGSVDLRTYDRLIDGTELGFVDQHLSNGEVIDSYRMTNQFVCAD